MSITNINPLLLAEVQEQAKLSPRKRKNYNFHHFADPIQRMLQAVEPGSYVRPHRHVTPLKLEVFLILQGWGAAMLFNDQGEMVEVVELNPQKGLFGVEFLPGVIHSLVSFQSGTVFYEVKEGPYVPVADKDFASWAPLEGAPAAKAYQQEMSRLALERVRA